jgi:hypothetical protein
MHEHVKTCFTKFPRCAGLAVYWRRLDADGGPGWLESVVTERESMDVFGDPSPAPRALTSATEVKYLPAQWIMAQHTEHSLPGQ